MKKNVISIIGVLVVIITAVWYYFYRNQSGKGVGIDNTIVNEDKKSGGTILDSDKVLVIYFSHSGNTKKLAKEISDQGGGDFSLIIAFLMYRGLEEVGLLETSIYLSLFFILFVSAYHD